MSKEPHDEVSNALASIVWPFVSLGVPVVFNESEHVYNHEPDVVDDINHETLPSTDINKAVCPLDFYDGVGTVHKHAVDWVKGLVEFFKPVSDLVGVSRRPVSDGISQVISEVSEVLVAFVSV